MTRFDRANNRSTNRILTIYGESKSVADWARDKRCVIKYDLLLSRIENGWDEQEAILTPNKMKVWSKDDDEFLKQNFHSLGVKEIANKLGRSIASVQIRGNKMGLKKIIRHGKRIDESFVKFGDIYGCFSVIKDLGIYKKEGTKHSCRWIQCKCVCGTELAVRWNCLQTRKTKSCGCQLDNVIKVLKARSTTHGLSRSRLYRIYKGMHTRCENKNCRSYITYGARSINICDEWKKDFLVFYNWAINNGYDDKLSLDRIDNDKGYYPENCRWTTTTIQNNNTTQTFIITAWNETKCLSDWLLDTRCKIHKKSTIISRIKIQNWSTEKALSTPKGNQGWVDGKKTITNKLKNCWKGMRDRCYNKNHVSYERYGNKGHTVCDEWNNSFEKFKEWAYNNQYKEGLSLDRINSLGNYEPSNCQWISRQRQSNNRSQSIIVSIFGESKTVIDWSKDQRCEVSYNMLRRRIKLLKWNPEKALKETHKKVLSPII